MRSLATKYRPRKFEEVVSQDSVKIILQNQLENEEFKNAYLFCGGAGTGKTTTARIVAREMNKGKGNPIEIDGASNNGVDNIRDIIENSKSRSLDSKYKVFIIDEVHMLSIGAFNALLKILEEPPAGTIFILCTTDPQKIPATILSRVQRFDFKRIPTPKIVERLQYIIEEENEEMLKYEEPIIYPEYDALEYIAKLADGGMRDSITMLDKVLGYSNKITMQTVVEALGVTDYSVYFELLNYLLDSDAMNSIKLINDAYMNGKDLKLFVKNFTNFLTDQVKYNLSNDINLTTLPHSYLEQLQDISNTFTNDDILVILESFTSITQRIKWETNPKSMLEGELILLCLVK